MYGVRAALIRMGSHPGVPIEKLACMVNGYYFKKEEGRLER